MCATGAGCPNVCGRQCLYTSCVTKVPKMFVAVTKVPKIFAAVAKRCPKCVRRGVGCPNQFAAVIERYNTTDVESHPGHIQIIILRL